MLPFVWIPLHRSYCLTERKESSLGREEMLGRGIRRAIDLCDRKQSA